MAEEGVAATKKGPLRARLAAATLSLLGCASFASGAGLKPWEGFKSWEVFEGLDVDSSVLYYQESDGRVLAVEPVLNIRKTFEEGQAANVRLVVDALTGATPNGASPSDSPQTFTRPSGKGSYTVAPGELPLDDTFHDTRFAVNGSWTQPLDRLTQVTLGANLSREFDFSSVGFNTALSRDFYQRNTTLNLGLSGEFDQLKPKGGIPIPFAGMSAPGAPLARQGQTESKTVIDGIVGLSQVLSRSTLMQFNYALSLSRGYHSDPYKLLSRVDGLSGQTLGYVFENRPESRMRHSLYWLTRHHLSRDVFSFSYRFFMDDWGIRSHTLDLNYQWIWKPEHYLAPHLRFYQQTEADFFRVGLSSEAPFPKEASADYRLAKFTGLTFGFSYGWNFKEDSSLLLRLEHYLQNGDSGHDSAIGAQRHQDLFPDLQASIIQIQYSF